MPDAPVPSSKPKTVPVPLLEKTMSAQIDPRGQRFAAALTTVVLATVLLSAPSPTALVVLTAQTAIFGLGAVAGVQRTPYAWVYRSFVRPHLDGPSELEDATPPRFAQAVGLGFALVALVGFLSGATLLGVVATGFALAAAFLNAAFGFCLGCEVYLVLRRVTPAVRPISQINSSTHNQPDNQPDRHLTGKSPVATKG